MNSQTSEISFSKFSEPDAASVAKSQSSQSRLTPIFPLLNNPEKLTAHLSNYTKKVTARLTELDQRVTNKQIQQIQAATLRCKVSGLLIAKLPGLPWGAIPHSLPFSSYSWKELNKFYSLATKDSATPETKHFTLFSLLAKCPSDFSQLNMRSSFHYYELTDKVMGAVYSRGLQRLYNFANFYSGLEPRYHKYFPKWRLGTFTSFDTQSETPHIFSNFFQILSLWEQQALRFEYKGVKEKGKKLTSDAERVLEADTENVYESVQESVYKKMRELDKNKIITIFDERSIDRKKLPKTLELLRNFYKLNSQEYKEFHYICYAAKSCNIARLEKLKGFIQDRAVLDESYPIEHTYFLNFLRWHIEAKKRVEQMLSVVQEEQENNPVFVKLRNAEAAQVEKLIASGMPDKKNFKTTSAYLSAVMQWKKNSGNGSKAG